MTKKIKFLYTQLINYLIFKILKKRFRKHVKNYPLVSGRIFDVQSLKIMLDGRFEKIELESLRNNVFYKINSHKSNALDIGANIGNHSLYFSDFFLNVFAFEPQEKIFELLKLNVKSKRNIKIFKYGASSEDKKATLYNLSHTDTGHSSIMYSENSNISFDNKEIINLVNLDNFLKQNNIENIKFVKIDVESNELEVLKGLSKLIKKDEPIIAFEQSASDIYNHSSNSINYLRSNGYNYFYQTDILKRKKNKFKLLYLFSTLNYVFKTIFNKNLNKNNKIKKIDVFETKYYPMIIASTKEL